jgi:hypothetical protein
MADPRADRQLNSGFYALYGWGRFTGRTFSATLNPPPTAARKGALLVLRFGLPETSIEALHSVELSARVNGIAIAPQTYAKPGEFMYVRDVPAAAFRDKNALVVFALNKVMPPHGAESREIGLLANTVGFEAK